VKRKTGSLVAAGIIIFMLVMTWDFICTLLAAELVQHRMREAHG